MVKTWCEVLSTDANLKLLIFLQGDLADPYMEKMERSMGAEVWTPCFA
jgi:hypothetical protein